MVLQKLDRDALMKITPDLHGSPALVKDLLPRLNNVLLPSDITRVEYRGNTDGWEWAVNDLLMFYQMRAKDLKPMVEALRAAKVDELALKISNISLASAAASTCREGEESFKRVLLSIQSHVRDKYINSYSKLRPLPQVNRVFDIRKIWVNLQFENRTELKDPEDYRACMLSAFEEHRLLLVKGHQGSGKTTAVRRIAFDWASEHLDKFDLVLVARYRDMENDTEDVIDLAIQWMNEREYITPQHAAFLQEQKDKLVEMGGRLLLLIDGLDEATVKCKTFDKALGSQDAAGFNYHVLLMSRPEAINEKAQCPSPIAFVLCWNPKAIVAYMKQHFKQAVKDGSLPDWSVEDNVNAVVSFLKQHRHAVKLIRVPLHITFVCLLQEDGALEPGMSSALLHRKLCYALVRRQVTLLNAPLYPELLDAFQGEFGTATRCPTIRNLALLAYEALVKGVGFKRVFSYNDLKQKEVHIEMCLKVGLLQTDHERQGVKYEFVHDSLQYYLAADLLLGEFAREQQLEICENVLANHEVMDQNCILNELWHCSKIESLEAMLCNLIEMALSDGMENKIRNSIGAFLWTWTIRRNQSFGADFYAVELLVRLGTECDGWAKIYTNILVPLAIVQNHHSAGSLLSLAGSGTVSMLRVHEHGIWFKDINTVVFTSRPIEILNADLCQNDAGITSIIFCLLEEGTIDFFAQSCRRMGWKKIAISLRAEFGQCTKFHLPSSHAANDSLIEISEADLIFKSPSHSISVAPLLQQILSFARIDLLKFRKASINDLGTALCDQRLADRVQKVSLERISFPNFASLQFGSIFSSFKRMTKFDMTACALNGTQLIDLLSDIKFSTICDDLKLSEMTCLQQNDTFTHFCSLISDWSSIQKLGLINNNFSAQQIVRLVAATNFLKLKELNLKGNPSLRKEHVAAFKLHNPYPEFNIVTD